jgi:hypothetical protein
VDYWLSHGWSFAFSFWLTTRHRSERDTDPETLVALLENSHELDAAVSDASVVVTGDTSALRRLLQSASSASPAAA